MISAAQPDPRSSRHIFAHSLSLSVSLSLSHSHTHTHTSLVFRWNNWKETQNSNRHPSFASGTWVSEFQSHQPLVIHLFCLFGGSFITLHYLLSSVGARLIDLEPNCLSVWDARLGGVGKFKHGRQFFQERTRAA